MRKLLVFILLLTITMALYKDYCQTANCRPAKRTKSCPDYFCYQCGEREVLNLKTMQCECTQDNYRINGICGQCPAGYEYDEITQWCEGINPCSINQVLVNGICQCQPGLVVIQNICQRCPVNQTYFPQFDACRCSEGFSLVNFGCILVPCGVNQEYSSSQQACVCVLGYYVINGVCSRCTNKEVYDAATTSCKPFVPPVCGFNEYFYECCCFCEEGFIRINGKCSTCPAHSHYVERLNACVCEQGYYFVGQQVKYDPYAAVDTSSSYLSNPGYIYSAYGASSGPGQVGVITQFSNYDQQGLNINGVNDGSHALLVNNNNRH